jgi:hypothetical protein
MQTLVGIAMVVLGAAAPVDVRVTLSPPEIPFYRPAQVTIRVDAPSDLQVQLPDMKDKFGGAEIHPEPAENVQTLEDGRTRTTRTYTIDAVKPGDYRIAPVEVTWGKDGRVTVPSPALRVRDVTPEEAATLERFEPIVMPSSPRRGPLRSTVLWALAALLAAVAVLALAFVFLRRRRETALVQTPRLPWETARDRLRALEARGFTEPGAFYVELSDILRRYIEGRFRVHAPERTTPEFLAEATNTGFFSAEHQHLLGGVLRHADRVKFALHEASEVEMEQDFNDVRRFIEETVPRMAAPAEEVAA